MADEKLASEKDIERLAYLKSLPQDKVEVTAEHEIKENTDESK